MNPPQASRFPRSEEGRDGGGQVSEPDRRPGLNELEPPGETPEPGGSSMTKQERKQFRRDINRAPKPGESVVGDSCLVMLVFPAVLMFLLVFVLGHVGLAVLLP